MNIASKLGVLLVAAIHLYIVVLEMFLWATPYGQKTFQTTKEFAESTTVLAANQGLYNGFLAAGLVWGLIYKARPAADHIQLFFLGCVAVAGIYGAATAKLSILFVQTVPATIALVLLVLNMRRRDH